LHADPRRILAGDASETRIWVLALDAHGDPVPDGAPLFAETTLGRLTERSALTRAGVARFTLVAGQGQGQGEETGEAIVTVRAGSATARVAVEIVDPNALGVRISAAPDGPPFDLPAERAEAARHPVAVDRAGVAEASGESYTMRFDLPACLSGRQAQAGGEGLTFSLSHRAAITLGFALTHVRIGEHPLFTRGDHEAEVRAEENRAVVARVPGLLEEEYAALDGGIEQSFVLHRHPAPGAGDLVIEGQFHTALDARRLSDEEGIVFLDGAGREALAYTGAVVRDALGRETVARMALDGGRVRITAPGAWLDRAAFPVVVDPLIGDPTLVAGGANWSGKPALAYNPDDDEWLAVWQDNRNGGDHDIYGQRVRPDGTLGGSNFAIVAASGLQHTPDVAYSAAAGEYLAVWKDDRNGNWDIYGRRVTAGGAVTGTEIAVCATSGDQLYPAVAYQPATAEWLVVWNGGRVQGQRVSLTGTLVMTDFLISQNTAQNRPDVAANPEDGEYLVVWHEQSGPTDYRVRARRVGADGALLGSELQLSPTGGVAGWPRVAYNGNDDEYLVVWQDGRGGNWDIYGQRVTAGGVLTGSNFAISSLAGDETLPSIAWDGRSGRYIVGWQGWGLAQRVWADGTLDGGPVDLTAAALCGPTTPTAR